MGSSHEFQLLLYILHSTLLTQSGSGVFISMEAPLYLVSL